MAQPVPDRPDTAERAAPEAAGGGIGDRTRAWLDDLGIAADPRHWQADATGVRAAAAALRDSHARAVLDQRLDAVVAVPLEIEPASEARRDRIAAADLREQLGAIEIDRISRELLHAVWYGYAIAEAIWEIDGARVRIADLRVRDPARFRWRADGTPLLVSRAQPRGIELPEAKFTVLRQPRQHGGQPHGPGVARWCLWPVWLKRQDLRMWSIALEKFGAPALIGKVSGSASVEDIETLLRKMHAMATGSNLVLPENQVVDILDSARRSGGDYAAFMGAMDGMIADAVLGQRATTEIGPWRGTAEVQAEVLERLVAADERRLSAALRHSVATWLTAWNHPNAQVPRLSRDLAPPEDLDARAKREEVIARTTGLRPTRAHVEQVYGGEWEEGAAPAQPAVPPEEDQGAALAALASRRSGDTISDAVDRLVRDEWEPMMEPVIEPILAAAGAALERGESLEEFQAHLPAPFADMDASRLTETLRRLGFSARLSGDAGLSDDT